MPLTNSYLFQAEPVAAIINYYPQRKDAERQLNNFIYNNSVRNHIFCICYNKLIIIWCLQLKLQSTQDL